jgi:hypothetical protein
MCNKFINIAIPLRVCDFCASLANEKVKAYIETHDGKLTLKVYYDPAVCNWDEAIAAGLASFGLKHGQAVVLALPFPNPGGTSSVYRKPILGLFRN